MQITELHLYPIKSIQAQNVARVTVGVQGLAGDREFMLTEPDGKFITARKDGELYAFSAEPLDGGILVRHQGGEKIAIFCRDFQGNQPSQVWSDEFPSLVAKDEINRWFSHFLGRDVQLRYLGETSQRQPKALNQPLNFADSNPVSLMSMASLKQVQEWCPIPLSMARFRPNLVIDGDVAFEEEQWQEIQIGEVIFEKVALVTRCVMTARDPISREMNEKTEPFRTLKAQHTDERGKPIFGIHLVPKTLGQISVGDSLRILR